ncbi:hypothetical protein [Nocardia otitidiscaviarum]|uniref:hypothetical protein n=1 Tax=Nocardia otitidiscaviarum TaxID=1823 RepID=UPI001E5ECE83|nr:hypothetical protein [Nocardia otitidiscaviarum]
MCIYPNRTHLVCLRCRVSFKYPTKHGPVPCPHCRADLIDAGSHLAVPRKLDKAGWRTLTAVLDSGLTFHGGCCGTGPGYRPRTPREVRERILLAERTGMPLAAALATADPTVVAGSRLDVRV